MNSVTEWQRTIVNEKETNISRQLAAVCANVIQSHVLCFVPLTTQLQTAVRNLVVAHHRDIFSRLCLRNGGFTRFHVGHSILSSCPLAGTEISAISLGFFNFLDRLPDRDYPKWTVIRCNFNKGYSSQQNRAKMSITYRRRGFVF